MQGQALITVGDHTAVFGSDDGVVTVPRFTIHQYGRADNTPEGTASKDTVLLVKEWTDPADGDKEIFFRNMISTIMDHQSGKIGNFKTLLSLFVIMRHHDNYPLFWRGPRLVGGTCQKLTMRLFTYSILGLADGFGRLFALKGTYAEYTPK
jgi:hypothetical protein